MPKEKNHLNDGKERCAWTKDALMMRYHDEEWGVPVADDQKQFEFLVLESAQAGLSWAIVLRKRENYRKAFKNFDAKKVAKFGSVEVRALLKNEGIIRNRLKIEAAINNAKRFLEIQKEFGTFTDYLKQTLKGPKINRWKSLKQLPANTPESDVLSKDLKKRGFKFLGSTVLYSHMQAVGMVNDHIVSCFRHKQVHRKSK